MDLCLAVNLDQVGVEVDHQTCLADVVVETDDLEAEEQLNLELEADV